jgi:NAD(P)-dependent dehydrogenase (short-subunit alcohol dehydrogenase family)
MKMQNHNWTSKEIPSQKGKVIIITGANSGLGLEAVNVLSQKEATIIMAVRDLEKGKAAVTKIKQGNPDAKPELMQLDLADLSSVHKFSADFSSKYDRLDILMNNAGVMWPVKREETKQGFEAQFGINHLGHFALTGLLLNLIKKTPHSRVVTQSSLAHKMNGNIHFDDLNWEKSYSKTNAYAQSKLANLLFTYELDRQFKAHEINAIAVAAHPGVTITNLFRHSGVFTGIFNALFAQNVEQGTLPILRASTEEGLTGAEFFGPANLMEVRGYPKLVKSNKKSHDPKLAKDLWSVSEKLTGVSYRF